MTIQKKTSYLSIAGTILIVVFVWSFNLSLASAETGAAAERPVKIGVTLPLSGRLAITGTSWKNGFVMGLDVFKKETGFKIDLVIEDNSGETTMESVLRENWLTLIRLK